MSILITGSSGFIASNLISKLIDKKIKFYCVDIRKSKYFKLNNFKKININNYDKLSDIIKLNKIKYIVNLAATPGLDDCNNYINDCFKNNLLGYFNVLRVAKDNNIKKIINFSSASVNDYFKNPSFYGFTKYSSDIMTHSFINNFNLNIITIKLTNVFGPFSLHKKSVVHQFFRKSLDGEPLVIHSRGQQKRDFIFSIDVANAIIKVIQSNKNKNIYEIKSNFATKINYLKKYIDIVTSKNNSYKFEKTPKGILNNLKISGIKSSHKEKKIISNLNYTYSWYKNNYINK